VTTATPERANYAMLSDGIRKTMQQIAKILNYPISSKVGGGDEGNIATYNKSF
jgi:hypothetical protein